MLSEIRFSKHSMSFRYLLFVALLLLNYHTLTAQVDHNRQLPLRQSPLQYAYAVGVSAYKGFILRHSPRGRHLAVSHPVGASFYINKHSFGKKYYERAFGLPDAGLALSYFDYRNPVLGKSILLSTYLLLPIWRFQQSAIKFKIGTGLAYHTNPHDRADNNSNVALGTPVTFSMLGALQYSRQLTERWSGQISLALTHFSNGAYTQPNLGINIPTLRVGISRKIQPVPDEQTQSDPYDEPFATTYYTVTANYGVRALEYGGEKIPFVNLGLQTSYRFNPVSAVNLGTDIFFQHLPWKDNQRDDKNKKSINLGMVAGHELFYGRLSLLTQLGVYIYRSFDDTRPPIYQRYGLRFAWTEHVLTSFCLKTHLGQAEYIEWGIGLKF